MTAWSPEELERFVAADEIELASRRSDGALSRFVTIWIARAGDELYVRSAYGPENPWFRRARRSGAGRLRAAGLERDLRFAEADAADREAIDAAYHAKYDHYPKSYVDPVVGPALVDATLRLVPAE